MQSARNAAASMKETAANIAVSAKSGMEKTKATIEEKVEKMSARDPTQEEMASQKKLDRMEEAEFNKQEAREHNSAAKQAARATGTTGPMTTGPDYRTDNPTKNTHSATGVQGYSTGGGGGLDQMSNMPGHGTGQPGYGTNNPYNDMVDAGVDVTRRTGGVTGAGHNPHAGGAHDYFGTGGGHQMSGVGGHGTGHQHGYEATAYDEMVDTGVNVARPTGVITEGAHGPRAGSGAGGHGVQGHYSTGGHNQMSDMPGHGSTGQPGYGATAYGDRMDAGGDVSRNPRAGSAPGYDTGDSYN